MYLGALLYIRHKVPYWQMMYAFWVGGYSWGWGVGGGASTDHYARSKLLSPGSQEQYLEVT